MCRTVHCIHRQGGLSAALMAAILDQFPHPEQDSTLDHGEWLTKVAEKMELQHRATDIALGILKKEPPAGTVLVGLESFVPGDPQKVGIVTLATYGQASGEGAFRIVGTDHLNGQVVEHTTPNMHGLEGLTEAMRNEMAKVAVEAGEEAEKSAQAEASQATAKAAE